jgi:vacuolar protein sorting-associated protein 29
VVTVGAFRIGLCHGHQIVPWGDREALGLVQRQHDVDVLITGHTHVFEAFAAEGKFFLNPGSITGAYSPLAPCGGTLLAEVGVGLTPPIRRETTPSFALMDIQGHNIVTYVYRLVGDDVKVEKIEFKKE